VRCGVSAGCGEVGLPSPVAQATVRRLAPLAWAAAWPAVWGQPSQPDWPYNADTLDLEDFRDTAIPGAGYMSCDDAAKCAGGDVNYWIQARR